MRQPEYGTARLRLLPAHPDLAAPVADYYLRNRSFLAPFEPVREEGFFTLEGQRALLAEEASQAAAGRALRFYLERREAPGTVIGMAGLSGVVRGAFQSCFLSYKLDAAHLGRGYMTEAVVELCRIAFEALGLHRVEANIMPRNAASLAVARRAGFRYEGLSPRYLRINGVWEDHVHMVRLAEDGEHR